MPCSTRRRSSSEDVVDLGMRQAGHRFVGDEQLGLGRHGARQLELAHLDLRQVARAAASALASSPTSAQELGARASISRSREMRARPRVDGVEQRDAQILRHRHAAERARQLKAAREAEPRAAIGRQPVHRFARRSGPCPVSFRSVPRDAVDQRALARAVGADEAEPLARRAPRDRCPRARRSRRSACRACRSGAAARSSLPPRASGDRTGRRCRWARPRRSPPAARRRSAD